MVQLDKITALLQLVDKLVTSLLRAQLVDKLVTSLLRAQLVDKLCVFACVALNDLIGKFRCDFQLAKILLQFVFLQRQDFSFVIVNSFHFPEQLFLPLPQGGHVLFDVDVDIARHILLVHLQLLRDVVQLSNRFHDVRNLRAHLVHKRAQTVLTRVERFHDVAVFVHRDRVVDYRAISTHGDLTSVAE